MAARGIIVTWRTRASRESPQHPPTTGCHYRQGGGRGREKSKSKSKKYKKNLILREFHANHTTNKYINRPLQSPSSDRIGFPGASCPWRPVSQETTRARRCLLKEPPRSPSQLGLLVHVLRVRVLRVVFVVIVIILFMARVASGEFLAVPLMLVPVGVVYRLRHQRLRHPRQRGVLLTPM